MSKLYNNYLKPALSTGSLLKKLQHQNLIISDVSKSHLHLKSVGYHRLSSYFESFQQNINTKNFRQNIQFEDIWEVYAFDRKLRILIIDAIEDIEIAFRAAVSDSMSVKHGSHWYLNSKYFKNLYHYQILIKQVEEICKQKQEAPIKNYFNNYHHPKYPPSWIISEYLSFGNFTSIFSNLKHLSDKKMICEIFNYHPTPIQSWMDSLRYTRNLCAHHARLWNRWFIISPKLSYLYGKNFKKENKFYSQVIIILKLLKSISPESDWKIKLYNLLKENSNIPFASMGFEKDWETYPVWNL